MRRFTRRGLSVALVSLTLLAACGGSSSDNKSTTSTTAGAGTNVTLAADGPPQTGGRLVYGLSSESDGWNPTVNRWAGDGTEVGLAIFDPLAAYAEDNTAQPYLAERFDHNADFTVWTIHLRSGVTFQDGTPLTSDAVVKTIEGHLASALTKPALAPIDSFRAVDDLTVEITMKQPWAAFPVALTGQAGVVPAPSQLADPDSSRKPVGTGPFKFVSWTPDKELVVERNPSYWRKDENGVQLPYLDGITFKPIADDEQRVNSMQTGDIDMTWTTAAPSIKTFRQLAQDGKLQIVEQPGQTEVSFVMLNLAGQPFDNPHARKAVALATDQQQWVDVIAQGVTNPAHTLFRPGTKWYSDIPIPATDLDAARQEVAAYQQDTGQPLAFSISAISTAIGRQQAEFLKAQWEQAGMKVDIKQTEASTFILDGVMGNYQAVIWAQFGSPDPDYEQVWWRTSSSAPVGQLSLNFPRHNDPQTDAALDRARATDDFAARKAAYDDVQRRFVEDLPYIYLDYPQPIIVAQNSVRGITNGPLPDGTPSNPVGGPGSFSPVTRLTQTWKTS